MAERAQVSIKKPEAKRENKASHTQKKGPSQSISPPVEQILFLQRTIGNQAVGRLIKSGILQAKLGIGQPHDIYEQEADRVVEQVMRTPEPQTQKGTEAPNRGTGNAVQRLYEIYIKKPHSQLMKTNEEKHLQTKRGDNSPEITPELESSISALHSGSQPLPEHVRAFFEPRFGQDFSQVRVHTDAKAAEAAREVNARAFTVGQDMVFGVGQYEPGTTGGKRLLAHELTHVVQQENAIRKIQRDAIPANLKLPCKWGDYFFEESKIGDIRILISMAEADRKSLPPLKQIAAQIEKDNKIIPYPKFQVKTCIISPNTTRFALYLGEPVLMIDPSDANIETIRHELGHAVFHFISHNKDAKINKQVKAENWIIDLTDIFLQLKEIILKKDKDSSITANFIVDPSEWNPGAKPEHPTDVDEFFASAKEAFQTDKKALKSTFIKYGKQNKTVSKLGDRLVSLLEFLFAKGKLSKQAITSDPKKIKEHLEGVSEPSKVEDTLGAHQLTDMLLDPDKRRSCK